MSVITEAIDQAMAAEYATALQTPCRKSAFNVDGDTDKTVRVDVYTSPDGNGFSVTGEAIISQTLGLRKIIQNGPLESSAHDWKPFDPSSRLK